LRSQEQIPGVHKPYPRRHSPHLLDTNTLVYALNRQGGVRERVNDAALRNRLATSSIVVAELLYGAGRSSRPEENRRVVLRGLERFQIVPFTFARRYRSIVVAERRPPMRAYATSWPMARKKALSENRASGQVPTASPPSPLASRCVEPGSTAPPSTSLVSAASPSCPRSSLPPSTSSSRPCLAWRT
jgi:hypothetical protein